MGPKCYAVQMLCQWRRKPRKIAPSHRDFVTMPDEDRATVIGNMHKKLVKIARVVSDILWQTYRQTHTDKHTLLSLVA